jgi:molecular chaperone DnaK
MDLRSLVPFRGQGALMRPDLNLFGSLQREVDRLFEDFTRGIAPANGGSVLMPSIDVTETEKETFDIDANGIVNVSAKDKASGKEQTIRIQASGGLSQADIDRMVKEAEAHAEEDKRRKELVEARNQADAAVYTAEKTLTETEGHAPADLRAALEQAVAGLKEAMKGEDVARIRQASERVVQAGTRLVQAAQQTASAPGTAPENANGSGGPEVVDAEFEEVDKRDRKAS